MRTLDPGNRRRRTPPIESLLGTLKMVPGKHVSIWRKSWDGPCNGIPDVFRVPKMIKIDLISLFKMLETGKLILGSPCNHRFTLRNRDQRVQNPYFSGLRRFCSPQRSVSWVSSKFATKGIRNWKSFQHRFLLWQPSFCENEFQLTLKIAHFRPPPAVFTRLQVSKRYHYGTIIMKSNIFPILIILQCFFNSISWQSYANYQS